MGYPVLDCLLAAEPVVIKGPALVCLNFHAATARRYVRRTDMVGTRLGWTLGMTHETPVGRSKEFDKDALERFRVTGT